MNPWEHPTSNAQSKSVGCCVLDVRRFLGSKREPFQGILTPTLSPNKGEGIGRKGGRDDCRAQRFGKAKDGNFYLCLAQIFERLNRHIHGFNSQSKNRRSSPSESTCTAAGGVGLNLTKQLRAVFHHIVFGRQVQIAAKPAVLAQRPLAAWRRKSVESAPAQQTAGKISYSERIHIRTLDNPVWHDAVRCQSRASENLIVKNRGRPGSEEARRKLTVRCSMLPGTDSNPGSKASCSRARCAHRFAESNSPPHPATPDRRPWRNKPKQ